MIVLVHYFDFLFCLRFMFVYVFFVFCLLFSFWCLLSFLLDKYTKENMVMRLPGVMVMAEVIDQGEVNFVNLYDVYDGGINTASRDTDFTHNMIEVICGKWLRICVILLMVDVKQHQFAILHFSYDGIGSTTSRDASFTNLCNFDNGKCSSDWMMQILQFRKFYVMVTVVAPSGDMFYVN